jgi:hypothetical protein
MKPNRSLMAGVTREGMAGKPVVVKLAEAREFILHIEETPDGIACDEADWVEATVTPLDGSNLWLAWQFDLPERHNGIIQAFRRAGSSYESARFKLRNLDPAANYAVHDLDQPAAPQESSGRELLERGLLISAPERPSARILTYQVSNKGN